MAGAAVADCAEAAAAEVLRDAEMEATTLRGDEMEAAALAQADSRHSATSARAAAAMVRLAGELLVSQVLAVWARKAAEARLGHEVAKPSAALVTVGSCLLRELVGCSREQLHAGSALAGCSREQLTEGVAKRRAPRSKLASLHAPLSNFRAVSGDPTPRDTRAPRRRPTFAPTFAPNFANIGKHWPNSGRVWPQNCQVRPKPAKFGPKSAVWRPVVAEKLVTNCLAWAAGRRLLMGICIGGCSSSSCVLRRCRSYLCSTGHDSAFSSSADAPAHRFQRHLYRDTCTGRRMRARQIGGHVSLCPTRGNWRASEKAARRLKAFERNGDVDANEVVQLGCGMSKLRRSERTKLMANTCGEVIVWNALAPQVVPSGMRRVAE